MRRLATATLATMTLWLAACDGGGQGSPAPSPAATATPNPAPTSAPTPSADAVAAYQAMNTAGLSAGNPLQMRLACSTAAAKRVGPDLVDLTSLAPVDISLTGTISQASSTSLLWEFGALKLLFSPTQQKAPMIALDYGASWSGEIVGKNAFPAPSATFGMFDSGSVCVYAAGPVPGALPAGTVTYRGRADGMSQSVAINYRLVLSPARAIINFAAGTGTFELQLLGKNPPPPFGDLGNSDLAPTNLGTLTGNLTVSGTQINPAALLGLPGYAGTVRGQLAGTTGMILTFEVHNAAGEINWGVVALDSTLTQPFP